LRGATGKRDESNTFAHQTHSRLKEVERWRAACGEERAIGDRKVATRHRARVFVPCVRAGAFRASRSPCRALAAPYWTWLDFDSREGGRGYRERFSAESRRAWPTQSHTRSALAPLRNALVRWLLSASVKGILPVGARWGPCGRSFSSSSQLVCAALRQPRPLWCGRIAPIFISSFCSRGFLHSDIVRVFLYKERFP
jgi:hypothetical protein